MYLTISRSRTSVYQDWFTKPGNNKLSRLNEFMDGFFRGTDAPGRQRAVYIDRFFMENPGKSVSAKAVIQFSSFSRPFRMNRRIIQSILIILDLE